MLKILISTSHSKIDTSNCDNIETKKILSLIKEKFTVHNSALMRDQRVLRGLMKAEHCFFEEQYSLLPTGLIPHLRIYLKKENINFEIKDIRKFPIQNKNFLDNLSLNTLIGIKKPRDYQIEAIQTLAKYRCGIVEAGTGAGKSFIIAGICHLYSHSHILILFNRISLLEQTQTIMINEYGFKSDEIGIIGGGATDDEKRITLMMVQSYQNIFHLFPKIKILITDEAHETGRSPTAEKVIHSCQNASVRIGFSATVETIENPYERMKLYSNIGPILFKLPNLSCFDPYN
jgi:superfamily II DNA or RNA helicase